MVGYAWAPPAGTLNTAAPVVIQNVRSPVWADADQTSVACIVKFAEFAREVPFMATDRDPEAHGKALYQEIISGKWGLIGPYVAPPSPPPKA